MLDRGATLVQIHPNENITWQEGPFNYTTYLSIGKVRKIMRLVDIISVSFI